MFGNLVGGVKDKSQIEAAVTRILDMCQLTTNGLSFYLSRRVRKLSPETDAAEGSVGFDWEAEIASWESMQFQYVAVSDDNDFLRGQSLDSGVGIMHHIWQSRQPALVVDVQVRRSLP